MKYFSIPLLLFISLSYAQPAAADSTGIVELLRTALTQVEGLLETQENLKAQVADLQSQVNTLQTQYDDSQVELTNANEALTTAQGDVRRLTVRGERLQQEVATLTATRDSLNTQVAEVQSQQDSSAAQIRDLQGQLERSQAEVVRLNEEMNQAETTMATLRNDYSTARAERDSMATVSDAFKAAEEELRQRIITLQQERDSFEEQAQGLQSDLERLQQEQSASQEQISSLQVDAGKAEALTQAQTRIQTLETEMEEARKIAAGDIETLRAQVLEMRDMLEASKEEMSIVTAERDALQQTLDTQANSDYRLAKELVLDVQSRIQNLQNTINNAGGANASQVAELEALRSEFAQAQESVVEAINGKATHVVRQGETFSEIASRYYGSAGQWPKILEANSYWLRGRNDLRPNDILVIP